MATSYVLALYGQPTLENAEVVELTVGIWPVGTDPFPPPVVVNGTPVPQPQPERIGTVVVTGPPTLTAADWEPLILAAFNQWCHQTADLAQATASLAANAQLTLTATDPTGN